MYYLREIEQKDLIEINKWRNDEELISCLGAPFRYINLEVDQKWYNNYMVHRGTQVRCAIVDEESDDILGLISLISIDHISGSAELHLMIGNEKSRGKGAGTFAVQEILNHAFNNLNLRRVELTVLEDNTSAIRLYEKMGFIKEGIKRQAKYKNGRYVNMILYSILRDEINKFVDKS